MSDNSRREQISAALDDEATMPSGLLPDEQEFLDNALQVRGALRETASEHPPDLTSDVIAQVATSPRTHARPLILVAAVSFLLAAIVGAVAVRPGSPIVPLPASADVAHQVIEGQHAISSFNAEIVVTEANPHPDIATRTLVGTLAYESPERLWLHLEQRSNNLPGWPDNTLDLVLDAGTAWRQGLGDCPVGAQPACLHPSYSVVTGLPPFAPTWIAPLDLVMPVDAFLPTIETTSTTNGEVISVDTTVARVARLVEGLTATGSIRSVHPTDIVRLELDSESLTLRHLSVISADNPARHTWAATNGYSDPPGSEVLRIDANPTGTVDTTPPYIPAGTTIDAGFTDTELTPAWNPPAGFTLYRTGVLNGGGPSTDVYAYSDGRAWIRIDTTTEWDQPQLFGGLGPLIRQVQVGDGYGYTNPSESALAVHTAEQQIVVKGSVPLQALIDTAAKLSTGVTIDPTWPQAALVTSVPDGALVPLGDYLANMDNNELLTGVGGPGSTGFTLTQAPAAALPPPTKGDVIETTARGIPARYAPRLGTLTWLDDGWRREIQSDGLDLEGLRVTAESLVTP